MGKLDKDGRAVLKKNILRLVTKENKPFKVLEKQYFYYREEEIMKQRIEILKCIKKIESIKKNNLMARVIFKEIYEQYFNKPQ